MSKSSIEWTNETWNPVTGCTKVSQGCKHCYAERIWPRLAANPKHVACGREFTDVQCHPERLDQPLRWKRPRMVFVNSMSDLFHEDVSRDFIDRVFAIMIIADKHTFQVLTKRAERMVAYLSDSYVMDRITSHVIRISGEQNAEWLMFPVPNIWLGVSVEDQQTADERIPLLLKTPAAVRFISAEPMIGPVDLSNLNGMSCGFGCLTRRINFGHDNGAPINWVIVGGESGPKARPMHPDWVRGLRDQCEGADVPFFFKQWGEWGHESSISNDGSPFDQTYLCNSAVEICERGERLYRVGKSRSGCLLDGIEYKEFPEVST